jgi:hypothetical protein
MINEESISDVFSSQTIEIPQTAAKGNDDAGQGKIMVEGVPRHITK